jgi:DNA-binding MarR family transcriptional regulator
MKDDARRKPTERAESFIGCPLSWLNRVWPLVQSEGQLVTALWLYRRHSLSKEETFRVPAGTLLEELGVGRYTLYRTLRNLEQEGIIAIHRSGRQGLRVHLLVVR